MYISILNYISVAQPKFSLCYKAFVLLGSCFFQNPNCFDRKHLDEDDVPNKCSLYVLPRGVHGEAYSFTNAVLRN